MSRHWTRPWGFPGKAIEIPTCKDAGGWDHGEINTENKYEELMLPKKQRNFTETGQVSYAGEILI